MYSYKVLIYKVNKNYSMGTRQSKPKSQSSGRIFHINHPQFKNASLVRNNEHSQINIKIPIHNEKQYHDWVKNLKESPKQHENLMMPLEIQLEKQGTCGSHYFLNIYFPLFEVLLSEEIKNRCQQKNQRFQEPQLWYLIFVLVETGKNFHALSLKAGDFRPENIFMNEQGQIKILTHLSFPFSQMNYEKSLFFNETTYLAPEQLHDMIFEKTQSVCNSQIAESFSVGLTCLDAATLSSSNNLYLAGHKFDEKLLIQKLNVLDKELYSQTLKSVIRSLCKLDPTKRISCTQLYNWLKPYEDDIKKLNTFQIIEQPSRIKYEHKINYKEQQLIKAKQKRDENVFIPQSSGRFSQKNQFNFKDINPEENSGSKSIRRSKVAEVYLPQSRTTYTKNEITNNYDSTIQMIDKQLQRSRKMFPS